MTTIDGGGGDGNNYGYDQPFAWGSLQPPPLGGAVGCNVCLTVIGDGVVGLGIRLLVVRSLVRRAIWRDVALMVVGNGVLGLGMDCLSMDCSTLGSFLLTNAVDYCFLLLPAPSRSHLHHHRPPARGTALLSEAANNRHCHQCCR
jgi:hypothetical protein